MDVVIAYAGAAVAMLVLDGLWLGFVARRFYLSEYGDLIRRKPRVGAAAAFYLGYVAAIVWLAVLPAGRTLASALADGAVLGLAAYGTYHFTNRATLPRWPTTVMAVDTLWGGILTAAAAAAGTAALAAWG